MAWKRRCSTRSYSHSRVADLIDYSLGFHEQVLRIRCPPVIQRNHNTVDDVLLFARPREMGATLLVKARYDLFQPVDRVILDIMADLLQKGALLESNFERKRVQGVRRSPSMFLW